MSEYIQIAASSIKEVMDELTKVTERLRLIDPTAFHYIVDVDYIDRLNTRIEIHLAAQEERNKQKEILK